MSQFFIDQAAGGVGAVFTLTGNSGGPVSPTMGNIDIVGSGSVTVAGDPGTSTLTISISGSGLSWNGVAGTSQSMAVNNGYVTQNGALTTLTLPASSAFGDAISIIGNGAGGWQIAQGAGQQIIIGSVSTTVGAAGTVSSSNRYDSVELICTVANTTWQTVGGPESSGLILA